MAQLYQLFATQWGTPPDDRDSWSWKNSAYSNQKYIFTQSPYPEQHESYLSPGEEERLVLELTKAMKQYYIEVDGSTQIEGRTHYLLWCYSDATRVLLGTVRYKHEQPSNWIDCIVVNIFCINHNQNVELCVRVNTLEFVALAKQLRVEYSCHCCSRIANSMRRCVACLDAKYCSKECQARDWSNHKYACKKTQTRNYTRDYESVTCKKYPKLLPLNAESSIWIIRAPEPFDIEYWKMRKIRNSYLPSLLLLPRDIIGLVLQRLDPCSKAMCMQTCRVFCRAINQSLLALVSLADRSVYISFNKRSGTSRHITQYMARNGYLLLMQEWVHAGLPYVLINGMQLAEEAMEHNHPHVVGWLLGQCANLTYSKSMHIMVLKAATLGWIECVSVVVRRFLCDRMDKTSQAHSRAIIKKAGEVQQVGVLRMMHTLGYKIKRSSVPMKRENMTPAIKEFLQSVGVRVE